MTSSCVDLAELAPPGPGQAPLTVHGLRAHIADRLDLLPSWTWRIQRVPFGLHHPVWVDDPDFDLGYHLREATVAAPGGPTEVEAYLASVLPGRLDQRHPLWQIILLHGLPDGRQALVFRFHHSIADGAALLTTLDRLFGPPGAGAAVVAGGPDAVAPPRPRTVLAAGAREQARNWAEVPGLLRTTLRRFKSVEDRRAAAEVAVPRAMADAPHSVLNDSYSADRAYARLRLPVADVQRVKAAAGCAVSDVVLAVVAGGLRTYLGARDQLPDRPLVANVPVANDPPGAPPRQHGNRFANFFTALATDVDDPMERLTAITTGTAEAKRQLDLQGLDTLPDWLDRLPPAVAEPAARAMAKRSRARTDAADFNVLVSNVRVTTTTWAVGGRAVEHVYMSGPVADGAGLNVTITGYGGDLHISIVANPSAVAEPAELAADLRAALVELVEAVPS